MIEWRALSNRHDQYLSISPTFGLLKSRGNIGNALKRLPGRYTEIQTSNLPNTNQFWPRSGWKKNRGSISGRTKGHSSSLKRAERPWRPPCILFNGNWGLILQGWKSQGLSWRLITTYCRVYERMEPCMHSNIRLREVYMDNFSFDLTRPDQRWKLALSFRSTCVSSTSSSSRTKVDIKSTGAPYLKYELPLQWTQARTMWNHY